MSRARLLLGLFLVASLVPVDLVVASATEPQVEAAAPVDQPRTVDPTWRSIGPPGASVQVVEVGPDNEVWALAQGILFVSLDAAATWAPRQGQFVGTSLLGVTPHPTDASVVLARTSTAWWRSTDVGLTWTQVTGLPGVPEIVFDPQNPTAAYAGDASGDSSKRGLYKSTDGGATFARLPVSSTLNSTTSRVTSVSVDPSNSYVWAATWGGVLYSTDGGATLTPTSRTTSTSKIIARSGVIFLPPDSTRSTDDGATWTPTSAIGNGQVTDIAVHPSGSPWYATLSNDNGRVYTSTDAASWTALFAEIDNPLPQGIAVSATKVHVGTRFRAPMRSGVYTSADAGANWNLTVNGLNGQAISDLEVDPSNPDHILATAYPANFRTTDGGANWTNVTAVTSPNQYGGPETAMDPFDDLTFFAAGYGVAKTTDGGQTFTEHVTGLTDLSYVNDLAMTPSGLLYAATDDGVFKLPHGGTTWVRAGLAGRKPMVLEIDPDDPLVIYAGFNTDGSPGVAALAKTTNGGTDWVDDTGLPAQARVNDITIDLDDSAHVAVAAGKSFSSSTADGVFETTTGGTPWTRINPQVDADVKAVEFAPPPPSEEEGSGGADAPSGDSTSAAAASATWFLATGIAASYCVATVCTVYGDGTVSYNHNSLVRVVVDGKVKYLRKSSEDAGGDESLLGEDTQIDTTIGDANLPDPAAVADRQRRQRHRSEVVRARRHHGLATSDVPQLTLDLVEGLYERPIGAPVSSPEATVTCGFLLHSKADPCDETPRADVSTGSCRSSELTLAADPCRESSATTSPFGLCEGGSLSFGDDPCRERSLSASASGSCEQSAAPVGAGPCRDTPAVPPSCPFDVPDECDSCGCSSWPDEQDTGDPVLLHSGAARSNIRDLWIKGRGFDFSFVRNYRSDITFAGPLGHNWDHNHDRRLTEATSANLSQVQARFPNAAIGDVARMDGTGRADLFERNADGSFTAPNGFYTSLVRNGDGSYTERDAAGSVVQYGVPNASGVARVTSLSDRNGNSMRYTYDAAGLLTTINDTLGRAITLAYDASNRITSVTDFAARQVQYTYDANGDLTRVRSPLVTGTPNVNNFPVGRTTEYTYSSGASDARFNHNLLTVKAPNEVASGGQARVEFTYDTNSTSSHADRVLTQRLGGTNASGVPAGGTISYAYTSLTPTPSIDAETFRNRVTDRNGNVTEYGFNANGNVVRKTEQTNRNVRASDPASFTTRFAHNVHGETTRRTDPEGNVTLFDHSDESSDRRSQGNLLSVTRQPGARGGDQTQIRTTATYEPVYNQPRAVTSPRNATATRRFDYEESCNDTTIGARVGRTAAQMDAMLTAAGMCTGTPADLNGDGITTQVAGNAVLTQAPPVTLPSPCPNDRLEQGTIACSLQARTDGTSQTSVTKTRWNAKGQPVTVVDAAGRSHMLAYHPTNDPDGDGTPSGTESGAFGYLKQSTVDSAGAAIRTQYRYTRTGVPTRIVDPRGVATDIAVNALDEVVQVTRAAQVVPLTPAVSPVEPVALTAFGYLTRYFYDFNGNAVLVQTEDRKNTSLVDGSLPAADLTPPVVNPDPAGGAAYADVATRYDILDQPVLVTREVTGGSTTPLRTRTRRDPNGNASFTILAAGNAVYVQYDERDLPYQVTRGRTSRPTTGVLFKATGDPASFNPRGGAASTRTLHYDLNGNLDETVDAHDTDGSTANNSDRGGAGDRFRTIHDGYDRPTSVVDAVGNQTVIQYDASSNVVRVSRFGPTGGAAPTTDGPDTLQRPVSSAGTIQSARLVSQTILSSTAYVYDVRERWVREDRGLFVQSTPTARSPDVQDGASDVQKLSLTPSDTCAIPGVTAPAQGGFNGCVSTRFEYDKRSLMTFRMEDDGDTHRRSYDGAGRVSRTQDPEGNTTDFGYDDAGHVIETRRTDVSQVAGVPNKVFLTTHFADSLGRPTRTVDNLGQTKDARWDSRGNLAASSDANGPVGTATINRRVFSTASRTINGFGNVTQLFYDGASRLVRTDRILTASGKGDGARIGATAEGQKSAIPIADTAQGSGDGIVRTRRTWDPNSLEATVDDDRGNRTTYGYDNLDRRVTERKGQCLAAAPAGYRCDPPTTITLAYNFDGDVVRRTDERGSVEVCSRDGLGRTKTCTITPAAGVVGTTQRTYQYDGLSRTTRATDNNSGGTGDDVVTTHSYDSLSRVIEERQKIGAAAATGVSSAWRADRLRTRLTYPNGRAVTERYDMLDRVRRVFDLGVAAAIAVYDHQGDRVIRRTNQNGTVQTSLNDGATADIGYDAVGRPTQRRHVLGTTLLAGDVHTYDRDGNRLSDRKTHDAIDSELYRYDSRGSLLSFDRGSLNSTATAIATASTRVPLDSDWTLDGVGNWKTVDAEVRKHSSFNEVIERKDGASTAVAVLSDANGNVTGDGTHLYAWDGLDRLRSIRRKSDNAVVGTYTYDASGRRARKVGLGVGVNDYLSDGAREIEERTSAGVVLQQYVYGAGLDEPLVVDRNTDGDASAIESTDRRLTYHQNTLGSVVLLTDTTGKRVEGYHYDAYGRPTVFAPGTNGVVDFRGDDVVTPGGTSLLQNPFLFTGRRLDPESKLYFYRARYFDWSMGRFLSRDSIGQWSDAANVGNAYGYVGNAPTNATDLLGLGKDQVRGATSASTLVPSAVSAPAPDPTAADSAAVADSCPSRRLDYDLGADYFILGLISMVDVSCPGRTVIPVRKSAGSRWGIAGWGEDEQVRDAEADYVD